MRRRIQVVGDTDYGIKVEVQTKISNVQGQNTFTKSFVVRTPTGTTDANVLTKLLVNEVKLDVTKILSAVITARPLTALYMERYTDNAVMTED
jgi:hypothetical protein